MMFISAVLTVEFCYCHSAKRKGFEFNLSFQQSYGIYKISHADYYEDDENSISYHNLKNRECEATKEPGADNRNVFNAITVAISTTPPVDSTTLAGVNKCTNTSDIPEVKPCVNGERSAFSVQTESDINYEETTTFEGPERRLSHEESQKPDLSDWEWCRSKSERTPRQVSSSSWEIKSKPKQESCEKMMSLFLHLIKPKGDFTCLIWFPWHLIFTPRPLKYSIYLCILVLHFQSNSIYFGVSRHTWDL